MRRRLHGRRIGASSRRSRASKLGGLAAALTLIFGGKAFALAAAPHRVVVVEKSTVVRPTPARPAALEQAAPPQRIGPYTIQLKTGRDLVGYALRIESDRVVFLWAYGATASLPLASVRRISGPDGELVWEAATDAVAPDGVGDPLANPAADVSDEPSDPQEPPSEGPGARGAVQAPQGPLDVLAPTAEPDLGRIAGRDSSRLGAGFDVEGMLFDNFFRAPDAAGSEVLYAVRAQATLQAKPSRARPVFVYGSIEQIVFAELGLADGATLGLRVDGTVHAANVWAGYLRGRPLFEAGDELNRGDVLSIVGEYSVRIGRDWEVGGIGELRRARQSLTPSSDNRQMSWGGALSYRGLAPFLIAEAGATRFDLRAEHDNDAIEYEGRNLYVKLRSRPFRRLGVGVRYRYQTRAFLVADPRSSNFGRTDLRRQLTANLAVSLIDAITWRLSYDLIDSDSSRQRRSFVSGLWTTGLSVRF